MAHVKFLRPMIADPTPAYAVSLLCIHSLIGREFCVGDMVDTDDDERGQIKWLDENFALVRLANTPLNVSPKVVLRDCLRFAEEGEEQ